MTYVNLNIPQFSASTLGFSSISRDGKIVSIGDTWYDSQGNVVWGKWGGATITGGTTSPGTDSGDSIYGDPGSQEKQDAFAYIKDVLGRYGLASEAQWAWDLIVDGVSEIELLQRLRERPAYKARFQGMELRRDNGLAPITEAEYIAYERQVGQLMFAAGLPSEFRSQDYLARLIGMDRSINEVSALITNAYLAVTQAPMEVRETFGQWFGPRSDSALAAFILDGEYGAAALETMAAQANVGGAAMHYGFSDFGIGLAEEIVSRGVNALQAWQTLDELAQRRALFAETVSETEDLTETQGVKAAFSLDTEAEQAVQRRMDEREAAFSGTGDVLLTEEGAVGLGAARQ